jgi:putative nucleotidyltransferase with HDIG domain
MWSDTPWYEKSSRPMRTRKNNTLRSAPPVFRKLRDLEETSRLSLVASAAGFAAILAIILLATQFGSLFNRVRPADFAIGAVAEKTFTVERDIVYTDENATRLKREAAGKLVPPVFRVNEDIRIRSLEKYDAFRDLVTALHSQGVPPERAFLELQAAFPGTLGKAELQELLMLAEGPVNLLAGTRTLLEEILEQGVISLADAKEDIVSVGSVEVWRWRDGKLEKEEFETPALLSLETLNTWLAERTVGLDEETRRLAVMLIDTFAVENGFLDGDQTEKHRQQAIAKVEPVMAKLVKDQIVIRRGDIVTHEAVSQIKAVGDYSASVNFNSLAGTSLFVILVGAFSLFVLHRRFLKGALKPKQIFFLLATAVAFVLYAAIVSRVTSFPAYLPLAVILPSAAVAILITLLVSANAGFIFSFILALLILPILDMEISAFLFALLTGIGGTAVVIQAERRIDLIKAGAFLSVLNYSILLALGLLRNLPSGWLLPALGWSLINGFLCSLIALGFLPLLEHLLNASTRFRLRELSDLNAPTLKRMLNLAPGTYSHSISVANLAESACSDIGANALLARVGAYYHDIGKIDQAEYFIENQRAFNKHDDLKPSLSVAVIKSHLKMGVEKAKEIALPPEIIDIISQHHGRGVIQYFYQRALENNKKKNVPAEDFAYPGNRPGSKEAAVVMLADAVEAASRTLKKPSIAKLEKFVWSIIMEKFTENELSESDLTLKDLEVIKKNFVQILAGYYHSRIEYPKMKEEGR